MVSLFSIWFLSALHTIFSWKKLRSSLVAPAEGILGTLEKNFPRLSNFGGSFKEKVRTSLSKNGTSPNLF